MDAKQAHDAAVEAGRTAYANRMTSGPVTLAEPFDVAIVAYLTTLAAHGYKLTHREAGADMVVAGCEADFMQKVGKDLGEHAAHIASVESVDAWPVLAAAFRQAWAAAHDKAPTFPPAEG